MSEEIREWLDTYLRRANIWTADSPETLECVLVSYFSDHVDRFESDRETASEDNGYFGEWSMEMTDNAIQSITNEVILALEKTGSMHKQ